MGCVGKRRIANERAPRSTEVHDEGLGPMHWAAWASNHRISTEHDKYAKPRGPTQPPHEKCVNHTALSSSGAKNTQKHVVLSSKRAGNT